MRKHSETEAAANESRDEYLFRINGIKPDGRPFHLQFADEAAYRRYFKWTRDYRVIDVRYIESAKEWDDKIYQRDMREEFNTYPLSDRNNAMEKAKSIPEAVSILRRIKMQIG